MRREHGARRLHFAPSYPKAICPKGPKIKGYPSPSSWIYLNLFLFFIDIDFDDVRSGAMRREQK